MSDEPVSAFTAVLHSHRFKNGVLEVELKNGAPALLQVRNSLIGRPGVGRYDLTNFIVIGDMMRDCKGHRIHYRESMTAERKKGESIPAQSTHAQRERLLLGDRFEYEAMVKRILHRKELAPTKEPEPTMIIALDMKDGEKQNRLISGITDRLALAGISEFRAGRLVTGEKRNYYRTYFIVDIGGKRWNGQISLAKFDRDLPHLLNRFGDWVEDCVAPDLATIKAIARWLGRGESGVGAMISSGEIPQKIVYHFSGRASIDGHELNRWILRNPAAGDGWAMRRFA